MGIFAYTDEFVEAVRAWDGRVGAPTAETRKKNRLRVFENGFIENVLATSHPAMPGVWFGGFVVYGLGAAFAGPQGVLVGLGTFAAGVLGFSLVEYLLHRFPFHMNPGQSWNLKVLAYLLHGYHHHFPNDKWRLVAPPAMSWPIGLALGLGEYLLVGPVLWPMLFGGTCAGYLAYDWIHYYTHHRRSPRTAIGKALRRAHMVHHFKLFHVNMGISSPLWDYAFGTHAWTDATVKQAMEACRALEQESGDEPAETTHEAVAK
ncbi:MAG: sterol desaturase family protein [Myxococcota bacterium]